MDKVELGNLISYAKDYLGMINPVRQQSSVQTDAIKPHILDPKLLFTSPDNATAADIAAAQAVNPDGYVVASEPVAVDFKCDLFYSLGLDEVAELDEEQAKEYEYQKQLLGQLEDVRLKHETNTFTKQARINLGFVDLKATDLGFDDIAELTDANDLEPVQTQLLSAHENEEGAKKTAVKPKKQPRSGRKIQFPVFTIPIRIEVSGAKRRIVLLDDRITPSFSFLAQLLSADQYNEFQKQINDMELKGEFSLPINYDVLEKVYDELLAQLKLSDEVEVTGNPLNLDYLTISLAAKSNFFLTQDLDQLAEMDQDELLETSFSGLVDDRELDEELNLNTAEGAVYFPFPSDKHQREVLGLLKNRASIVQGPPGTGKSQTIANVIAHLVAQDKRVLFVSQKDQAIRVVKEKLKELDVPGLYGYIPDRYSTLHTRDDDIDGVANELARIKTVLDELRTNTETKPEGDIISAATQEYDAQINLQREYFALTDRLKQLEAFDVEINDPVKFLSTPPLEKLHAIRDMLHQLQKYREFITYNQQIKTHYAEKFGTVNLEYYQNVATTITNLKTVLLTDMKENGFSLTRKLRNNMSLTKHNALLSVLPAEVSSEIKRLAKNFNDAPSKSNLGAELGRLELYFQVMESEKYHSELEKTTFEALHAAGLTGQQYHDIMELVQQHGTPTIDNIASVLTIKQQIKDLKLKDLNALNKAIHTSRTQHQSFVRSAISNKIRHKLTLAWGVVKVRSSVEKAIRTFSKSKRAYKTYDNLKGNPEIFNTLLEMLPVWMMSLEDVSRIVPAQLNLFDYVIIDEASQCNLAYAIPAMVRAKHTILFGDTLQMRDTTIKFKSNAVLTEMARKYRIPDHMQIKGDSESVKSVMDIGLLLGFRYAVLRTHYRSPRELIGFSNEWFYAPRKRTLEVANATFMPYKDTQRVMLNHVIESTRSKDESLKTNMDEAEYIVKLVADIKADPALAGKSIGVLSFFTDQSELIRKMIDDEDIKVSNIEGVQGDERDIIIYSFVICDPSEKKRYVSLTGEGGEINKDLNEGRVNVAFSRAKYQVHCVTSMRPEQWPEGIWIKRYLEYVEECGRVSRVMTDGVDENLFDSNFEREFYLLLKSSLGVDYVLQNQVESCGFKIDFVLENRRTGRKLAIECDGPTHFEGEGSDVYVQGDWERQSILEAAKWRFYRVGYGRWDDLSEHQRIVSELTGWLR